MNDVIAIIPARSGSKGVVDKNIHLLGGRPLIAYSIVAALKSSLIDRVIVSTDSAEYARIAKSFGAEVPFLRPLEISGDLASDNEFFQHTIDYLRQSEGYVPTFFAHLRPTTPLRDPKIIDEAIQSFVHSHYSALRSVHKMTESSYKNFEIDNGKLKRLSGDFDIEQANRARQEFPDTFEANGYIDVIRSELVDKKGLIHGNCAQAFVTEVSYEIDNIADLEYMEYLFDKKPGILDVLFG